MVKTDTSLSQAFHIGSRVWVPQVEVVNGVTADGSNRKRVTNWSRGHVEFLAGSSPDSALAVRTEDGALLTTNPGECYLQNENDDAVDDLVRSDFLHEPGILHTLRVRYALDAIYTFSGSILIAANPHKRVRHLYGARMMAQYRGVPLGELSPHTYAIAEAAYTAMMMDQQRQAILISGESGAGKTESAKMVMQYLAHRAGPSSTAGGPYRTMSGGMAALGVGRDGGTAAPIEEQVLESNPLLEAFGNAKTARNDNSSRFGKFVEIDFDATGRVAGAAISTYLLERSRVVSINPPERSFHIFYQLCAGATEEQRQQLKLGTSAMDFRYLAQSDALELEDVDDAEQFRHTLEAMRIVGLDSAGVHAVLRCVAGILHLGNIVFMDGAGEDAQLASGAAVPLAATAEVLGLSADGLQAALTTRTIETRGERIIKRLNAVDAAESRDALAKALYSRLFDWLVGAINRKIGTLGGGARTSRTIGILDIYGFESFERNSFEQLCINLANEKLQQAFNAHVFKGEQAEYAAEGILWSYIDFVDNQDVLDLLEGTTAGGTTPRGAFSGLGAAGNPRNGGANNVGVFPLIDEACRLPRASHQDLAHALRSRLAGRPRFGAPRRQQNAFVVDHYAGEVCYATDALLDKNRDFVVAEHAALAKGSSLDLLQELFAEADVGADGSVTTPRGETPSPLAMRAQRRSAFMLSSVGARFRRQLGELMATLAECQPHFIRCIKPNPVSTPGSLEPAYVLEQLRAGGVLEAVRIACAGFPTRKPFLPFAQRYALLLGKGRLAELGLPFSQAGFVEWDVARREVVVEVVKRVLYGAGLEGWQLGSTRVFLRAGQLAQLEGARGQVLIAAAVRIQAAWRCYAAKAQLANARSAATRIQAVWRSHQARQAVKALREERAVTVVQAAWRMHRARAAFLLYRRTKAATTIQANWRCHSARQRFLYETEMGRRATARAEKEASQTAAATVIQSNWRRLLAQRSAAERAAQAQQFKALETERDAALVERDATLVQLHEALTRANRAEAAVAAAEARVATLQSQLQETLAELESAKAMAASATAAGEADASAARQAAAVAAAELEQAHKRAAIALQSELDVARQQKADADVQAAELSQQLREAQAQVATAQAAVKSANEAAISRSSEVDALQARLEQAESSMQASQATHAAAIAAAQAAAAAAVAAAEQRGAAAETQASRAADAALQDALDKLQAAQAEAASRVSALSEGEERRSHLESRVEALTARTAKLEADARAAAAREQTLLNELEFAKRAAVVRSPTPMPGRLPVTPLRRTITAEIDAAAASPATSTPGIAELDATRSGAVEDLVQAAVSHTLPAVEVWVGATGGLSVPHAAWLLHRCLLYWAREWRPAEISAAAQRLEVAVVDTAAAGGLAACSYWLSASLATGALLKMRSVGRPELDQLFKLGDAFIGFTDLHAALGTAVAEALPVNVTLLLSDDAKRSARRRSFVTQRAAQAAANGGAAGLLTGGIATPTSPADAELAHMGGAEAHWRALLGGVANVVYSLRAQGVPAAAVRAVAWATMRYIDGELLNALLLRRDCCSVSAAKALQTGLAALKGWVAFEGPEWCCTPEEADRALERALQASRYLVQGKDDCVRKALKGVDVLTDLGRLCPALTLQQVHRLTEHQHDDWLAGAGSGSGGQNMVLLETLRRLMMEQRQRLASSAAGARGGGQAGAPDTAGSGVWITFGGASEEAADVAEDDEEDLLVDSRAAFELFRSQHQLTRRLLTEAARSFVQAPGSTRGTSVLPRTTATPPTAGVPLKALFDTPGAAALAGPRLPNGSLPQLSPVRGAGPTPTTAATRSPAPSGLSLLDTIDQSCADAALPSALASNPTFAFLKAT